MSITVPRIPFSRFSVHNGVGTTEASSLEWPPGGWPEEIEVSRDNVVYTYRLVSQVSHKGDLLYCLYEATSQTAQPSTLKVYND